MNRDASRRPPPEPERGAAGQRRGRVLVVEDEPDVAELLRYNLVRDGYEVFTAANGAS